MPTSVERREVIKWLAASLAVPVALRGLVEKALAASADPGIAPVPPALSAGQLRTIEAFCEAILPGTAIDGGARAAGAAPFIQRVLSASDEIDRTKILSGLTWLDEYCRKTFSRPFEEASREQQDSVLRLLSAKEASPSSPGEFLFVAIKQLTLIAFLTSEKGIGFNKRSSRTPSVVEYRGCNHPEHLG